MLIKKSIVLNSVDDCNKRAILTLECDGEMTKGVVRLYNFSSEPKGIISLGIFYDGQVVKAGLTHLDGFAFSFNCQIESLPDKFSCAVVNFVNGEPRPILYGTSAGYSDHENLFNEVISSLSMTQNTKEVEDILDEHGIDFDDELKEEIQQTLDNCMGNCNCEECEYKKYYFQYNQTLNKAEIVKKEENKSFYLDMKGQIDNLFANNPTEDYLQNLIPNSKWVKVGLENDEDYYVLGLIYDNEKLLYISYGVPGVYQKIPPRELSGFPVWFPLDEKNPQGFGYWLSYQDAESGESVKAIIV